jgi:hypothetical protein
MGLRTASDAWLGPEEKLSARQLATHNVGGCLVTFSNTACTKDRPARLIRAGDVAPKTASKMICRVRGKELAGNKRSQVARETTNHKVKRHARTQTRHAGERAKRALYSQGWSAGVGVGSSREEWNRREFAFRRVGWTCPSPECPGRGPLTCSPAAHIHTERDRA